MKYLSALFIIGLLIVSCSKEPCATKEDFLASFETYLQSTEGETQQDTVIFSPAYKDIVNNCYKKFRADLTLKERQDFWKKSFRNILDNYEGDLDININGEKADPFNQYVMEEVKALIKDSGASFLLELQDFFKDDISRVMEVFSSELNTLAEEFMKMFGGESMQK